MKKIISAIILSGMIIFNVNAQQKVYIKGNVFEEKDNQISPLIGASVYWLNTSVGVATDLNGAFEIEKLADFRYLIVSFVGYQNDTIDIRSNPDLSEIVLKSSVELAEVEINYRRKTTEVSLLDPMKIEKIGEEELLKAACCNLSESFETNPSVDVSFTDAVTGTRQIQMLGLAGPYTQITRENMPDIRGLSSIYGLTYTPGTWIESIQLNKGTGSVSNGFESVAGQINVNLRNPASMDRLYLNIYGNEKGRIEANLNLQTDVGKKMGTGLLIHAKNNSIIHDKNDDNFMDHPIGESYILLNRWELYNKDGLHFQVGAKGTYLDKTGGDVSYNLDHRGTSTYWGMHMLTKRLEGWSKLGKVNKNKPYQSVGFQVSGGIHDQQTYFGLTNYESTQSFFYANLMYQDIISNTNHNIKTGISVQYDDYKELFGGTNYDRKEIVPGGFVEYTYNHLEKFNIVAGLRYDYHNHYGSFLTPRMHLRYAITDNIVLRASGGRGQRTANIFADNSGLMASSRQFVIQGDGSDKPYGLKPEVAWNYGLNLTYKFKLDYRDGAISFDFYRTDFQNQIIIDLEQSPQQALFYNLEGQSYSNSFQAQLDYELIKRLDARIAYRWYDVKTTYGNELLSKPLIAQNRAFINLGYTTRKYWKFDATLNWQGQKRIPDMSSNPDAFQLESHSPDFFMLNLQISKTWKEKFDVYVGAENVLNYTQSSPILSNSDPFSQYFDSSMIWGPIFGRNIYFGIRYKIK